MAENNDSGHGAPINREMLEEHAALYVLGALEGPDRNSFEMLLELQDPEAISLFAEMQSVAIALGDEIEPRTPPVAIKANLLEVIEPTARPEKPPSRKSVGTSGRKQSGKKATVTPISDSNRWRQASIAISTIAAVLVLGMGYFLYELRNEVSQLKSQLAISDQLIQRLEEDLITSGRLFTIACAPGLDVVTYDSFDGTPEGARGNVLYTPDLGRALVVASNMPQAPQGKNYQVWMLDGTVPIDAGLLIVNSEGQATLRFETIPQEDLSAFAVTVEPKGGSPAPTGEMLFLAAVN